MDQLRAQLIRSETTKQAALRRGLLCISGILALASGACRDALSQSPQHGQPDPLPEISRTYDSSDALAETILEDIATEDVESLKAYPLSKEEFRTFVWPALPSARPERNVPFDYAWGDLSQKSILALRRTYSKLAGRRFELLELRFAGETSDYGSYLVHRDARVRVRDARGHEEELDLFGSVLEWDGRYKLFSYVTD